MSTPCIQDAKLEETGFSYTMSLIQGKYKMYILYALAGYGVVRFNELKKYINTISYKTLSSTLKELENDGLIHREEYPQIPPIIVLFLLGIKELIHSLPAIGNDFLALIAKSGTAMIVKTSGIQTGAVLEFRLVVRAFSATCRCLISGLFHQLLVMTEAFLGFTHGNHLPSYVFPEATCPGPCNSRR